jgi:lauroyl/myristoyl acyltransferase
MTEASLPATDAGTCVDSGTTLSPDREHCPEVQRERPVAAVAPAKSVPFTERLLYEFGLGLITLVQALPLTWVACLGRFSGALGYHLDAKHRRIVHTNLVNVFGREKTAKEIAAIARENFKRIAENHLCAIKTAAMSYEQLCPHLEFTGLENFPQSRPEGKRRNAVVALGHFGNFELYARLVEALPHAPVATTYRGFKQASLNRLLGAMRARSGCVFLERRADGAVMRGLLNRGGLILGLLADQSSAGIRAPFLGRDCNVGLAPATLALRYQATLSTAICYRIGLAKWRVEVGKPIPTNVHGHQRKSGELMMEVNRELEVAVRRDPANWFWVHRRWKS